MRHDEQIHAASRPLIVITRWRLPSQPNESNLSGFSHDDQLTSMSMISPNRVVAGDRGRQMRCRVARRLTRKLNIETFRLDSSSGACSPR
jgi:hypothetical protein